MKVHVGFWSAVGMAMGYPSSASAIPTNAVSRYGAEHSLEQAIVADFFGQMPSEVITRAVALRVPEVKAAIRIHTNTVAKVQYAVHREGALAPDQPAWLTSTASGVSPHVRWKGVIADLFFDGWALLGAELGVDGLPVDMIHIPFEFWKIDKDGMVTVTEGIPARYQQRLILIPLGTNGILTDGIDSIRQARKLELARQARLDAPPAATELHITDTGKDGMTRDEKAALVQSYVDGRNKHSVSVTPSYLEIKERGTSGQLDLFESGMNSLRLQIALHAGIPAGLFEAGKEGGTGSNITYSNQNGESSELWLFGSSEFAYAITARLSMDDVVGPNAEVRADLSALAYPAPNEVAPESSTTPVAPAADPSETPND